MEISASGQLQLVDGDCQGPILCFLDRVAGSLTLGVSLTIITNSIKLEQTIALPAITILEDRQKGSLIYLKDSKGLGPSVFASLAHIGTQFNAAAGKCGCEYCLSRQYQ